MIHRLGFTTYKDYFNFSLNTTTWKHFVNKQILARVDRLMIEKFLHERKQKEYEIIN